MNVSVVPYDHTWPSEYSKEAGNITSVLECSLHDIHHIGSTAIPNMTAKPVIDILIEATSLSTLDTESSYMEALGYDLKGEYGIVGRRYFQKINQLGLRSHHVHAYKHGTNHIKRHLAFRDYLIAHRDVAHRYSLLKQELAQKYSRNREQYVNGKESFVKETERLALDWQKHRS